MDKIVQYLIKPIPYFSHEGKSWEAIFSSLIHQGTKPPLQSKDPALLQRDWKVFTSFRLEIILASKDPPLLQRDWKRLLSQDVPSPTIVERPRPAPKGLKTNSPLRSFLNSSSKDPALLQRDWDWCFCDRSQFLMRRKTLPCSKGIETVHEQIHCTRQCVERPCPVPKGLRLCLVL